MSMIGSLIDELRELALWLDDEFYDAEATKVRDAADTIWQLRDDLQRANDAVQDAEHDESRAWDRVRKAEAEADRLREENARLRSCLSDDTDNARQIMAENARLRELAADMLKAMRHMEESAGMDVMVGYSPWFAPKLHELGVEVSDG